MTNSHNDRSAESLDMKPCPFCGSEIKHIESWAKSFNPPRLYHEWHHVKDDAECQVFRFGGRIVASATNDPEMQDAAVRRWNTRAQFTDVAQGSSKPIDDLVKLAMLALFADMQGFPPMDTQLGQVDKELDRIISESGLRSTPEYAALAVQPQASPDPIGYAPWHPTYGWRLDLASSGQQSATAATMRNIESAAQQGWTIQPFYAAQPPAAPVETDDAKKRHELAQRLVYVANSMTETMSQGFDSKLFIDPEMRDDLIAAAGLVAAYKRGDASPHNSSSADNREVRCYGCGSAWTDADLIEAKKTNPRLVSCCPERKPLDITAWMAEATAAQERSRKAHQELQALWEAIAGGPKPRCRDCADHDGRCQGNGLPCDPQERALEQIRLLRALPQEVPQTIDTAPKDGSHILAWRIPVGIRVTNNTHPPTVVHWFDDEDEPGFYTSVNELAPEHPFNPTHWSPLPAGPSLSRPELGRTNASSPAEAAPSQRLPE